MTNTQLIEYSFWLIVIWFGAYLIVHEEQISKFERKAWVYIKAFFKALYVTAKDFIEERKSKNV